MFDRVSASGDLLEPPADCGIGFDLRYLPPGPELAAAVAGVDMSELSGPDRVALLEAQQRLAAHYDAMRYRSMIGIVDAIEEIEQAGSYDPDVPFDYEMMHRAAAAEIATALHLTRNAAHTELSLAMALDERFRPVWDLFAAGVIDRRRVWAIVSALDGVDEHTTKLVLGEVLTEAPQLTTGQVRARIRKIALAVDPEAGSDRYEAAVEDRRVVVEPLPSGAAGLFGLDLPADRVATVRDRINRLAQALRRPGEARTMDQLRADVFLDLLEGTAAKSGGVQATVHMTIDADTLMRLNGSAADLAGYGPIIADIARDYAALPQTRLEYDVRDPNTGEIILSGLSRRRPQAHQARWVRARYRRCAFPGCRMPAQDSDLDHIDGHAAGGPTSTRNLTPLCRHHHMLKERTTWTYRRNDDGTHTWTSPLHRTYTTGTDPP